jgi:hypothetical protein
MKERCGISSYEIWRMCRSFEAASGGGRVQPPDRRSVPLRIRAALYIPIGLDSGRGHTAGLGADKGMTDRERSVDRD